MDSANGIIDAARNGKWLPAEELRSAALNTGGNVTLNLEGLDHLDCAALQVMLALALTSKERGFQVHLSNLSPSLAQNLQIAGLAPQPDSLITFVT